MLELDTFSRVFINATRSSLPPAILVFFDLLAAFATLAIAWLFKVLEASGAPLGFRNYVESMYIDLLHFVQYRGTMVLFGLVTQGMCKVAHWLLFFTFWECILFPSCLRKEFATPGWALSVVR